MDSIALPDLSQPLLSVPYEQRWELLKPTIEQLYLRENKPLADVIKTIQSRHGFAAVESQYKYQIRKWKLKKSTSTTKKDAICRVVKSRARQGKTSVIRREARDFDTKNLQRYLKAESNRAITLQPAASRVPEDAGWPMMNIINFGNRIFMNWNMPYGVLRPSAVSVVDHVSPVSDIQVTTPLSNQGAPSPMAVAVAEIAAIDRAQLFVEGKHNELLQSMGKKQRVIMSTWIYQFWLFAFTTAKHWGRGPRDWTADILGFDNYHHQGTIAHSSPNTPGNMGTPASQPTSRNNEIVSPGAEMSNPISLCRWSIHCKQLGYEPIPSPPESPSQNFDYEDGQSWPPWPNNTDSHNFTEKICNNLESNRFSNLQSSELPIGTKLVAGAARRSPKELLKESLGFCIMSRNDTLLRDLLERSIKDFIHTDIHPFHLAASYLDGSKQCCTIFEILMAFLSMPKFYLNDLGHTVLDQLMITILKTHSSCFPSVVDDALKKSKRFEGEDVDVCGRWDADSDCVRKRLVNGTSSIPFEWKHVFCHTSVQAICHCIGLIFGPDFGPSIHRESGLFVRRCQQCGLKLQLLPLHTLMLVGYHLSMSGCESETLFGIIACLVCLLSYGSNPLLKANISLKLLMGTDEVDQCSHQEMDPCELAEQVIAQFQYLWSREIKTAWQVIIQVLKHSQAVWQVKPSDQQGSLEEQQHGNDFDVFFDYSGEGQGFDKESHADLPLECSFDEYHENFFGHSRILASLWAAVQTELVTYRRLKEDDPWISKHFDMDTLRQGLIHGGEVAIALVQENMMKPFCACGLFLEAELGCPTADDASSYYFSNLDDWNRSSFLSINPDLSKLWYHK